MKKWLLVLGMITCMTAMSACGNKAVTDTAEIMPVTQEQVDEYATNTVSSLNKIVTEGAQSQYADNAVITSAVESWQNALKDMGDYCSVDKSSFSQSKNGMTINVTITGTKRNANMEIIMDSDMNLTSITTVVKYSMAELMEKAALNTLLGMGTVFVVLILISFIISGFKLIPNIQKTFSKEKKTDKSVDGAVAQIIQNETQTQDDFELIAVISAAIAASEGRASSDGYVVRSIRRVR